MGEDFFCEVKRFDRESFLKLFEYILENGIRKVYFSTRSEYAPSGATLAAPARVDFCISGRKHMRFPCNGSIQDVSLLPGEAHFSPAMTWKLPLWDQFHQMGSIVYESNFIRFTYINYDRTDDYFQNYGADIFYHTSQPLPFYGKEILQILAHLAEDFFSEQDAVDLLTVLLRISLRVLRHDCDRIVEKRKQSFLRIDNYLRENFLRPISRESVAAEFQLTPSYISRLYAEFGEMSFNHSLRTLRLEHAAMLLKNTLLSIDEITEACAYASTTFLITAFRKQYGLSPGKYRRRFSSAASGNE